MPELPEVETVKLGLQNLVVGKQISKLKFDWPKGFPNTDADVSSFLVNAKITDVRRRGKGLLIDLNTEYTLLIHLKMTGQLVYVGEERFGAGHPNDSLIDTLPDRSTRVTFTFSDDSTLYFNDQRKFGYVKLLPTALVPENSFIKNLGPEPLEDAFTKDVFVPRIRRRANTSIKAALLDQSVLAGIGNIYADETLFAVKLHPATLVKTVGDKQLYDLVIEIKRILNLAIEKGGSTDRNYVNAEGKKGSYMDFAKVFRREGQPCVVCGTTIEKSRVAGRGTHTCPQCQVQ